MSHTSKNNDVVCPVCEAGKLHLQDAPGVVCCDACEYTPNRTVVEILQEIKALPDAIGDHACECGHPEMLHLPDGVFHCPACRSEVRPLKSV